MNRVELQDNGFPFRAQTVRFMQETYTSTIENLAKLHGENYILWGCDETVTERTEGAIVVDGELVPFRRSPKASNFTITEVSEAATYKSGLSLPAYFTREAKCDASGLYSFSNFKRVVNPIPTATNWQSVEYANEYEDEASYGMFSRIGEDGKGLIVGTYERKDGKSTPGMESDNEDIYFNGVVFTIAQTNLKPLRTQYVQIYSKGFYYKGDTQYTTFSMVGAPCLGWIGTDGVLRAKFDKASRGYRIYKTGYVCAEIDLL